MYTSHIGKRFLEILNKKNNSNITASDFFRTEVFEKFYNHEKYFKWVVNSPFVQKLAKDDKIKLRSPKDEHGIKLQRLISKIKNEIPDSSFAIGYPASDITFDTSGQVSNLNLPMNSEEVFNSWIGAGFGLEVEGKQVLYIDKEDILWTIYNGWGNYREFLNDKSFSLKGNEIDAWNTIWLDHNYSEDKISPKLLISEYVEKSSDATKFSIKNMSWISLIFLLSRIYPKEKLTIFSSRYIFDKQKYVTLGFIQLNVPEILRFNEFFNTLFSKSQSLSNKKLRRIYQTEFTFQRACELGSIGLRAIEPKDLKKFMPGYSDKSLPKLKSDESSLINYSIYITWIIAMLNNKELLDLAEKSALALRNFVSGERQTKTKRQNTVEEFLRSRNRKDFIESITAIMEQDASMSAISNELVNQIMLNIPPDNIPLFVTLLRFKYLSNNK